MPIVRTYGDPGVFGRGAYEAGRGIARNQARAQQRAIDARFVENRLAARERIVAMQTAANLERGNRVYDAPAPRSSGPESIINEYAQSRKKAADDQAELEIAEMELADQQAGILGALEDSYAGREKDFLYHYTKREIQDGNKLPDRVLAALGIKNVSDSEAEARQDAEVLEGQVDAVEPKTDRERLYRRTLQQGRAGDLAAILGQREKQSGSFLDPKAAPLTDDALAARTQLEGFASMTSDRSVLEDIRSDLEKNGAPAESLAILDERLGEIEREEVELKAPAAFESAMGTFRTQLNAIQAKEGRTLNVSEKRKMLAGTLEDTAKSFGITVQQLGDFIRSNDENRRMAEELVQRAQTAIEQMRAQQPGVTPVEQQFGSEGPKRPVSQPENPNKPPFGL